MMLGFHSCPITGTFLMAVNSIAMVQRVDTAVSLLAQMSCKMNSGSNACVQDVEGTGHMGEEMYAGCGRATAPWLQIGAITFFRKDMFFM